MNPLKSILNKYKKPVYQDGGTGLVRGGTQEVQKYQKMLNEKYGAKLAEDGAWGPKTQAAYEKFVTSQKTSTPTTPTTPTTSNKPTSKPITTSKPPIAAPKKQASTPSVNVPVFGKMSAEQITKAAQSAKKPVGKPAAKPTVAAAQQKSTPDLVGSMRSMNTQLDARRQSLTKAETKPVAKAVAKPAQMNPSNVRIPGFGMSLPEASRRMQETKPATKTVTKSVTKPETAVKPTTNYKWPSLSDLPKAKTPAKVETKTTKTTAKPAAKLNPANVKIPVFGNPVLDRRQLPQTGVVIDRGTNETYVLGNKKAYSYPVLTGMSDDPMANENMYTTKQIDKLGKKAKVTPTGYYIMDKDHVSEYDKKHYQGNIRALRPISAYGVPAPKAANTALHQTYDPAYRNQFYSQGPEQRRQSYGCTNAQGENICRTFKDVANKDTALIIDSRLPSDRKLLEQARKRRGYKSGGMLSKSKLKQSFLNKYK